MLRSCCSLAALVVGLLLQPRPGSACSCGPVPTPAEALERAHVVFSGTVMQIEGMPPHGTPLLVAFRADRWWKGGNRESVSVVTMSDGAACGFEFSEGEAYLVFADTENLITEETGHPMAGICSRTKLLSEAQDELPELGPAVTALTPTLWSRVKALFR